MPRANKLNLDSPADLAVARDYVLENLPGQLGVPLELDARKANLINPKNQITYAVVASRKADGYYSVPLMQDIGSKDAPSWLAVLDPDNSNLHLVDTKKFSNYITTREYPQGAMRAMQGKPFEFDLDWGRNVQLVRKSVVLGKGDDTFEVFRGQKMATPEQFVHLHVHSMYSLLDCATTVDDIAKTAVMNGQPGIAVTDHGVMFGTWKHYKACKDWGVKPILGCEFYIVDDVKQRYTDSNGKDRRFEYHITVVAMNQKGWENICKLCSLAHRDNYYYVGRIDKKMLFEHNEGLIVTSGCFKGFVAWHLQEYDPQVTKDLPWYRHDPERSYSIAREFKQVFGDRYYIELQSIDFARYMKAMPKIAQLADDLKIPKVVTNDCHYEVGESAILQAIMSKISNGAVGDGLGADLAAGKKGTYYIKAAGEIDRLGILQDVDFTNTCQIMERCTLDMDFKGYLFPNYAVEQDRDWKAFQDAQARTSTGTKEEWML